MSFHAKPPKDKAQWNKTAKDTKGMKKDEMIAMTTLAVRSLCPACSLWFKLIDLAS